MLTVKMKIQKNIDVETVACSKGTHVIYIGADWCKYCQFTKPALEEIANEGIEGFDSINIIDMDENPMAGLLLQNKTEMKTLPKVVIFKNGKAIAFRGSAQKEELKSWLIENRKE